MSHKRLQGPDILKQPPKCKIKRDGPLTEICFESMSIQIKKALGTKDKDLVNYFLNQLAKGTGSKDISESELNALLALLHEIGPLNGSEAMLAIQMIAVQKASIEFMKRVLYPDQTSDGVDLNLNRTTKLMRVFNQQLETLSKIRNKGHQQITVQRVEIKGGQTVVGNVSHRGGGDDEKG